MSRRLTHTSTVSLHACERLSNYHFMSRFANSFVTPDCVAVLFVVDDTIFLTQVNLSEISLDLVCSGYALLLSLIVVDLDIF